MGGADVAAIGGNLYTVSSHKVNRMNPQTGTVDSRMIGWPTGYTSGTYTYGALWTNAQGELFARVKGVPLPAWTADFGCTSWAQFFLKYVIAHPAVTCVIPATDNPRHLADNLAAVLRNEPTKPFSFRPLGIMAAIGRHKAVAEVMGLRISGLYLAQGDRLLARLKEEDQSGEVDLW